MKRRPTITFPIIQQHSINNHFKNNGSMQQHHSTMAQMTVTTTTTTSASSLPTAATSCWQFSHCSPCANNDHHQQVHSSWQHHHHHHSPVNYGGGYARGGPATANDRNDVKTYLIVSFVAIVCYVNGLQGDFVHDDIPAITMNKDVIGINPITNVFRNDFWGTPMSDVNSHKSYRPLTTLSFRLNYFLFGLRPLWFHTTNILLHAAACILFTRVCSKIAGFRWNFTILAGVLFAVHPIHTEAVTGIVGRADVLACIFFLLSVLIYHGNTNDPNNTAVWISIVLGGLSMLAKETGITVFLINIVYDIYRSWPTIKRTLTDLKWNDETNQIGRRLSRLILAMGVLLAVRLALLQGSLPRFSQQDNPAAFHPNFYTRILTFCYLAAFNWWLVLCPATLSHDWQMGSIPLLTSISDTRNIITFIAFCAALLIAYKGIIDFEHQRHVPLVLGFLFLVLPFLPATNLVVTVGFVVAERVLYIPSVGSVILIVYGVQMLWERMRHLRRWVLVLLAILVASGACKTVLRNQDWQSRQSLLRAGLQVLPHNAKLHYNFGNYMRDSSRSEHAIRHYKEALRLWPSYASAHNNLGTLMHPQTVAEHHFLEAIRYSNEHLNAHYNLGQLYRKSNRSAEAVQMLQRCIKIEPDFTAAYLELVKIYGGNEAGKLLHRIVAINSNNVDLRLQYGNWLLQRNLLFDALHQYQKGLSILRTHQMCMIGASHTLRKLGQHSRLHQMILRWQLNSRLANGGGKPIQKDIYLRDWSIKNELRNRALIYDTGYTTTSTTTNDYSTNTAVPKPSTNSGTYFESTFHETDIHYRVLKSVHCNRSDHTEASLKICKKLSSHPEAQSTTTSKPAGCKDTRCKAWSKKRHKPKDPTNMEPNDSITPFIVSNMLDKL